MLHARWAGLVFCWLALAAGAPAWAGPPPPPPPEPTPFVPVARPAAYSLPLAVVVGTGAVRFRIALGLLLARNRAVVGLYRSYPEPGHPDLSEQYGLPMLTMPAGVVLASTGKTPLLILHGRVANAPGTYRLQLDYLTRFGPRAYAQCHLTLQHSGAGAWRFVTPDGAAVTRFTVRSGLDGIRSVAPCVR